MGHMKYASDVGAPVEVAFTYTDNHQFVPDWAFAVAAFEPLGDSDHGSGAIFGATLRVGFWHPTIECEITDYRRNAVIEYTLRRRRTGKSSPAQGHGGNSPCTAPLAVLTLRFDPLGYGRAVLTSETEYWAPEGLTGRLLSRMLAAAVQSAVRRTESQLRREIEEFHGTDLVGRIA
ncbi:SRPBCC family protein [Nocardia sp. SYP-A9097]|uniref:SRPBCC family protein n=1 Tax=Nocardia sp. SYP-A9097 TaxID=2663237 RepID=UPI00129AECED|nr:SRPBCC family protein [Nocardia sp. SYP-A9097]MRH86352.1 SRPBCC family protein [Nocardia sp. SYP-A9097]